MEILVRGSTIFLSKSYAFCIMDFYGLFEGNGQVVLLEQQDLPVLSSKRSLDVERCTL